jgi:hypothetical protein
MTERINSPLADEEVTAYAAGPEIKPIPDAPYRGVEPFRFIDQQIFVARETETWNLLSNVMIYRGVLLYGGSGSGKSSMINAGLIPQALKENFLPNLLRVQPRLGQEIKIERISIEADGKPPYLPSTFAKDDTVSSFDCSIADIHATLKRLERAKPEVLDLSKPPEMRPLLIFDQFEEFITLFEEAAHAQTTNGDGVRLAQRAILEAVTDLIHDETLPIKILFVFREDYLGKLSILFENSPDLLDQYLRLLPPRVEKLQEIIRAPFKNIELSAGFTTGFSKGLRKSKGEELTKLADRIAAELREHSAGGGVNLSELQIVCRKLWESDSPAALIKKDKIVQTLIEDYWADALKKFPGELYEPAVALLSHMITSSNTRNIVSEDDLLTDEMPSFNEDLLRKALDALVQSKLVRREPRNKLYFYEIVSEYLVPWIQRLKAERIAELERVETRENLGKAEAQNRILRNWRRGLVSLAALLLIAAGALAYVYRRAKAAEAKAVIAAKNEKDEREKKEEILKRVKRDEKIFALLQNLTDTSVDARLATVRDIGDLVNKEGISPEAARLLRPMVLGDSNDRVVQAGRELLPELLRSNPELEQHAIIHLEDRDNRDQAERAARIRKALSAQGVLVDDPYQYGGTGMTNQLKHCKISEEALQPDAILKLINDVDTGGNQWSATVNADCEKSNKLAPNSFEIWFSSEKQATRRDLLAVESEWKNAKITGDARVLQRVFADEFKNVDSDGNVYTKSQWIDRLRGYHPSLAGWKIEQATLLSYGGNTASLSFVIVQEGIRYGNIDVFIKRNGRWQVLSSQSTKAPN